MRNSSTLKTGLALLGLFPAALHAQSLAPQQALEKVLATRAQWANAAYPAADLRISSAYADPNGLEHVYVQQLYLGIPVYNRVESLAFANGRLASHAGRFVPIKQLATQSAVPALSAAGAVSRALLHVAPSAASAIAPAHRTEEGGAEARQTFDGAGIARRDIAASLTWTVDEAGHAHLAWNVNIEMLHSADWWNVRVDAATGLILGQDNWTVEEKAAMPQAATLARTATASARQKAARRLPPPPPTTTTATFAVVPYPRENPGTVGLQVETDPWLKAGAGNSATTYGWNFDGTTNYALTRGNNVAAYDDSVKANAPGRYALSTTTGSSLRFQYTPNFSAAPTTNNNRSAATVNLFYWNNIIHDLTYQYGFTEASGNYQADNLSRGGAGNDYVKAEAQDGSGTNNANFSAPPDGTSGRMQMYLWSPAAVGYNLQVTAPASIAGNYPAVEGNLSTANQLATLGPISGQLGLYTDAGNQGCAAHTGASLTGKIALIYRGTCAFVVKIKNAQLAGATAAVVINNAAGPATVMGGSDNTITIPAVMVSQADGAVLAAQVANGVQVTLPRPAASGPALDGDFDNGIVVHEYGHGVSIRLTGGPANSSCLDNAEQGGEGWSDYLSLMMTTNWANTKLTDGPNARPVGTYAIGQAPTGTGIRRYPYSTSLNVNPLTYANVATAPEVHNIGEIWCAALWDMTWNIIQQQGSIETNLYNGAANGGNVAALQLVMQGMKLQPCQPGFLDARDGILAADSLLYHGQYHSAIWNAFARRGMGYSAVQGSSGSATDQVAGFDMPPPAALIRPTPVMEANLFDVSLQVRSGLTAPTTAYSLTDELPAGMRFVSSSTGGTLVGNKVTFNNITFTAPNQVRTLRFAAQAIPASACAPVLVVNDDRDQNLTGGFVNQSLSGTAAWSSSTAHAYSGAAWFAPALTTPTDFVLTSAPFTPTGLSLLSFYHYYNFEPSYDGGTIELSTDNGTTWKSVSPYFIQNGYNGVFDASTKAPGEACFSGLSAPGANPTFIRTVLDLRSFAGTSMRIRFRTRSDDGSPAGYEGWYVDKIQVINGCGGDQRIELRDAAGALQGQGTTVSMLLPATATATQTLAQASEFGAHPNPFGTAGLRLALSLPTAQPQVALTLTDVTGRVLLRRTADRLAAGPNTVLWPEAAMLPPGLYLVRALLPDGSSQTLRVERE